MSRKHISLWVDENILNESDANLKMTKFNNRGEYIEQALMFYNGYLHNQNDEEFVSRTLMKSMQGMMDKMENRIAKMMFKQAVEIAKVYWLTVRGFHIEPEDVQEFHDDCVEEVKRINGAIRFNKPKKDEE